MQKIILYNTFMQENIINAKANQIRDVLRYANKFKNAKIVIYLDDEVIDSPLFLSHMQDIALIHQTGLRVVIVPGARKRINQILNDSKISCNYHEGIRITDENAMPLIKMAAFDVSNIVMTSLAAHQITATIGNWVRARSMGVVDGIDFGTAGEIDKIQTDVILNTLDSGFVPIFPCIGWNSSGKPYNISSVSLAKQIAINIKADKLFFVTKNAEVTKENFNIPKNIAFSEFNDVPAMDLDELSQFFEANKNNDSKIITLLHAAQEACKNGVTRTHILNGSQEGTLPSEIFSELGCGTMIYSRNYGGIRSMTQQDVPDVLSVMNPFITKKILLPRTSQDLLDKINDYIVYEIDGCIRACASLHVYEDGQAEIAGIAVSENFSNLGIGPKLIDYLLKKARNTGLSSIFILTTKTSDWFEHLGFKPDKVDSLPQERRAIWTPERNSKVFRITL